MRQPSRFWDRIAERYAKRPVADEDAYQKKLQVTRDYLRPDMEVLEFGCGTGSTAIAHAPYVKHIQAIDISSKMIDIAQRKAAADNVENVTFVQSGIEEYSAPDQSLDAVLGLSILHLLENKEEAIAKVHRMLKPGGIFVTSTACLGIAPAKRDSAGTDAIRARRREASRSRIPKSVTPNAESAMSTAHRPLSA